MALHRLTRHQVHIPADVPAQSHSTYLSNFYLATKHTGRLFLHACDQKLEHLNDDFVGPGVAPDDADPEHLFRIAHEGTIGAMAAHYGLIAKYGRDYPHVPYIVKLNGKTNLRRGEPFSHQLWSVAQAVDLERFGHLSVVGVGYTIYPGSEFEAEMLYQAAQIVADAHRVGYLAVFWMYPRGKAVRDELDSHLVAGAAGVGCSLGADFVKVNYPRARGKQAPKAAFREAIRAAGRTGVICAGGRQQGARAFLKLVHEQLEAGARGAATGRNLHQRPLAEAARLTDALAAMVYEGHPHSFALEVAQGTRRYKL